ncbi:hypothetical protein [Prauserella muralis]|uniref:Uncharacterized protein n=1 Tax=Prauserella muralis TaxID=588067 RepID=A0A2V4B9D0_9PSEU|nr:hypothetical protein [Prauserella muralis]PXY32025.1 hypothetical protein BAY60_06835 [Prauserella muralis]TWE13535.1 hypothetical protein FHX69_5658 [Prauserella muralis]
MSDVSWPAVPGYSSERLHQPWRLFVALAELVVAGVAVWGAFLSWDSAFTEIVVRLDDGTELVSRHVAGNWVGAAIGLGGLAGLLVVDAVRQASLGARTRRRRRRASRENGRGDSD